MRILGGGATWFWYAVALKSASSRPWCRVFFAGSEQAPAKKPKELTRPGARGVGACLRREKAVERSVRSPASTEKLGIDILAWILREGQQEDGFRCLSMSRFGQMLKEACPKNGEKASDVARDLARREPRVEIVERRPAQFLRCRCSVSPQGAPEPRDG